MSTSASNVQNRIAAEGQDEYLFGWDATPGIVSVWAARDGRAIVWRRVKGAEGERVLCTEERFRPWLFAATLEDLKQLGNALLAHDAPGTRDSLVSYRVLDGPVDSYRYLLSARDGSFLERTLCAGASRRLGRSITNLNDLSDDYYRVGPVDILCSQDASTFAA